MADESLPRQPIRAYMMHPAANMELQSAPIERDWMDAADQKHPYRCLPLNIANQNGWVLTCPVDFRLYWYGGPSAKDIEIRFADYADPSISSHFGSAVLTFSIPYLFQTPKGINLWAKGPSNRPKDGIQPLEGIIETDWAHSTFTMNWMVTRPNEWIEFRRGEPVCMIVPIPRGLTESLDPVILPLSTNPELHAKYTTWEASRRGFLEGLRVLDPEVVKRGWQKDYFQGKTAGGTFDGHQTRLHVREFTKGQPPSA
jgi:hypothetical protein